MKFVMIFVTTRYLGPLIVNNLVFMVINEMNILLLIKANADLSIFNI